MTKRDKIFNAGAKLFARHSFNSVGIRDIASEAGVNSAMISYYFGGKIGLLKEIFSCFVTHVIEVVKKSMTESVDHYELVDRNIDMFISDARQNRDIYLVGLRELNLGSPELQDLREQLNSTCWESFADFLQRTEACANQSEETKDITFTAVLGIIFSDYLLGGGNYIDDDSKVDAYKKIISDILKHGSPAMWQ